MKYFISIVLLCFFMEPAVAQLCTNTLGEPVVNITFGKGQTPFDFGPPLGAGITTLSYQMNRCPANGEYAIIASTSGCFGQWHTASDHTLKPDGTKDSPNGFFMCIDAAYNADDFYVQTVDGLCPGTTYQFGAWIVNMFDIGGGTLPNITFTIEKTDGTVLQSYNTGNIPVIVPFTWRQYSFFFVTPPNITSVVLRMRNNAPGGGGNDLGLDDITFRPAGPNIALSAPGGTNNSVSVCSGSSSNLALSAVVDSCYPATAYQWQESTDNGTTWNDIPGATNSTYNRPPGTPGTFLYRLAVAQVGNMGINSCQVFSSPYTVTVNSSVASSVSIAGSPSTGVCAGTPVTFTATPVNGGATPSYQWQLNGVNVGTNSTSYTNNSLANNDIINCILSSSVGCQEPDTSNHITVTVNPVITPAVSIAASSSSVCAGNPVTFTATPVNGIVTPGYQWKVNGNNVGSNSPVFTSSTLANGDVVTCTLTSNAVCATSPTVVSNSITMNSTVPAAPAITISADKNNICPAEAVTFTAVPVLGGTVPTYQWMVNGNNAGSNSATFTSSTLANGDIVSCTLTSSESCVTTPTAISNNITVIVKPSVAPAVSIAASNNTICAGTSVTFTATPVNGGATPSYQWQLNGVAVGSNSASYTNNALANNEVVSCVLSGSGCQGPVTSNSITVTVNPVITPAVSIAASSSTVCAGSPVTFTATPANGITTPDYQWKVNGNNVGSDNPVFTSSTLVNGDVVTCTLTSNAVCAAPPTVVSNSITIHITVPAAPAVTISVDKNNICPGDAVTFTAVPVLGGTVPTYQWTVNGSNAGSNSATFTSNTLANSDVVSCTLTSSESCVTSPTALSNNITVVVKPAVTPAINIVASDNNICAGTPVTFTATPVNGGTTPGYQWLINGANVGNNNAIFTSATLANADVVNCTLSSILSCAVPATSNSIVMKINPLPTIVMGPDKTIIKGNSIQLTPAITGNIQSYAWLPPNGLNNATISNPIASPLTTTVYGLTVVTTDNCSDSASITVKVLVSITIPNIFSPNGDGINDVWNIGGLSDYTGCSVDVFNRYGQPVFHSNGYNQPWDGTYKGKPLPLGEYYYIINLRDGSTPVSGGVTVIR